MCGIAGIIGRGPGNDTRTLGAMLGRIRHRGPDEEGILTIGEASLGARRLAIIDLAHGQQPMTNETGTVMAVQNGEIYNFVELREELERLGHRFRTRNDTEVLPHAFEEWGEDLVPRLRGMFALAIWDERTRTLLLARDRFGKKPLVWSRTESGLAFASEIQALLAHPAVRREVDPEAIDQYLTFGYVPAPRSGFRSIRKVEPGHTLVLRDGDLRTRRYWVPSFEPKLAISRDEAAEEIRRLIDEAVRIRLMSDVPIGAFLSGGLDSSTVVAYMARHSTAPVRTFSVGFDDARYDERRYARIVAQAFGTDHHELVVDVADTSVLPMLARHVGEPFADSSIVPTYHVARATRAEVTVALNGDGGDELFAGYDRYKAAALARVATAWIPPAALRAAARLAQRAPERTWLPRPIRRGRRFAVALGLPPEHRFLRWTGYFTGPLRSLVAGPALANGGTGDPALLAGAAAITGARNDAERYMASDMLLNLPGDLLVKMDIATMAASLEGRSPLLDHKLAEFVARLPVEYKISPRTSKILLRRAMRGVLPAEILERGKMGFSIPVSSWFRGPLVEPFRELVLSPESARRGFVSAAGARRLLDEHLDGRADRAPWLWSLYMLELWFRECVDAPDEAALAS